MAESINNIVQVNQIISAAGLQYANFVSTRAIAEQTMLKSGVTFEVDTFRTYGAADDVAVDFEETSPVYLMAQAWFRQPPRPGPDSFQVWMRDDVNDTSIIDTLDKAKNAAPWKFIMSLDPTAYQGVEATALSLQTWGDANGHFMWFVFNAATATDENETSDIPSALKDAGGRLCTQKYRSQSLVDTSEYQNYIPLTELAYFQRFNFDGVNTTVDPEFKPMTGAIGEDLQQSQYLALQGKLLGYYTDLDLKGQEVTSRCRYSWSTSAFGETVDDVFTIETIVNRAQVDSFNYLSKRKRGLRTPQDYAGLLNAVEDVARQANINGSLATDAVIQDPRTGEDVVLKNGYLMISEPTDVQDLTAAQIAAREYPPVQIIIVLARSARQITVNLYIE